VKDSPYVSLTEAYLEHVSHPVAALTNEKGLTDAEIGPVVLLCAVLSLLHHTEDLRLDRVSGFFILFAFALQVMLSRWEKSRCLSVCCR
jgi:hypothetical protein